MTNIFDIITVGSNVLDMFVKTDSDESELIKIRHGKKGSPVEELIAYPLGSKIIINHLEFQIGGGGTNTAVAFSRLGLRTGYVGKIGKDENGLKIFSYLKKEHINFLGSLGEKNGISVILDSVGEDRTILTYKGCNNNLAFRELKQTQLKAKAYYLCSMMGESYETLKKIALHAHQEKALLAFNPSEYLAKEGTEKLRPILMYTDVFILNDEEAQTLGGFGDVEVLAARLSRLGPKTIVITMGARGVLGFHENTFYRAHPPSHLTIHETTGAGDAFGSTLIAGIIMEESFETSLRMAMLNAESVISHYGAKNILLTKKQLHEKLLQDKREVQKYKKRVNT